jgi:thiol-disulfide isomerase/thioredoxin
MINNKKVICNFNNAQEYLDVIKTNPGLFIIKFGAKWCQPCKKIKHVVDGIFSTTPDDVVCADIDISEFGNKEIYDMLKRLRMINGVPTLFMYRKGNNELFPDESVSGTNPTSLHEFFLRCGKHLAEIKTHLNNSITA